MEPDSMGKTDAEWVRIIGREFYGEAFRPEEFPDGFESLPTPDQAVMAAQLLGMGGFDEAAMRWFRHPTAKQAPSSQRFEALVSYLSARRHLWVLTNTIVDMQFADASLSTAVAIAVCFYPMVKGIPAFDSCSDARILYSLEDARVDVARMVEFDNHARLVRIPLKADTCSN